VHQVSHIHHIWRWDPSRFLTNLSFAASYQWFGLDVKGYHLINILLHILVSLLVFFLGRLTYPYLDVNPHAKEQGRLFAGAAALIFLTHPVQTSAVTYIVQRSEILIAFFYLAALCLYILYRNTGRIIFYCLSLGAVIFGVFCKPSMVTLPIALILYEWCFLQERGKGKDVALRILPYFLIVLLIPVLLIFTLHQSWDLSLLLSVTKETPNIARHHYLLTQLNVIMTFLRLLFIPVQQNLDYDYPLATSLFQLPTILSSIGILILLGTAVFFWRRQRIVAFAIFWFFLTLSITSSIFPLEDLIFEHRLYLPMVAFAFLIPLLIFSKISYKKAGGIFMALIIVVLSIFSLQRNRLWADGVKFMEDVAKKSPNKARVHNMLGSQYFRIGNMGKALASYSRAIEIKKDYPRALNNRGNIYLHQMNLEEALTDFNEVVRIQPDFAMAYSNRGLISLLRHQYETASADFDKAIELCPGCHEPFYYRGNLHSQQGRYEAAVSDYSETIQRNPYLTDAYLNRGMVYFYYQRAYEKALLDFEKVLDIDFQYKNAVFLRNLTLQAIQSDQEK